MFFKNKWILSLDPSKYGNATRGRPSNLQGGLQDFSMKWYTFFTLVYRMTHSFSPAPLWSCLWEPTASGVMFLRSWLFFSIHYLLGVMIARFKVKRKHTVLSSPDTLIIIHTALWRDLSYDNSFYTAFPSDLHNGFNDVDNAARY